MTVVFLSLQCSQFNSTMISAAGIHSKCQTCINAVCILAIPKLSKFVKANPGPD